MNIWPNTYSGSGPDALRELVKYKVSENVLPMYPVSKVFWEIIKDHAKANGQTVPDELPQDGYTYYGVHWIPSKPMPEVRGDNVSFGVFKDGTYHQSW